MEHMLFERRLKEAFYSAITKKRTENYFIRVFVRFYLVNHLYNTFTVPGDPLSPRFSDI